MKKLSKLGMKAVKGGTEVIGRCTMNFENGGGTVYACDSSEDLQGCFDRVLGMCMTNPYCVAVGDCRGY